MIIIIAKKEESEYSLQDSIEMVSDIKASLKDNEIVKEICKEHGFDLDIIDGIAIEFGDPEEVDASAKTVNARIFLNEMLLDGPYEEIMRYAIHELVHALQHMEREENEPADPYESMEYLDRPDELEAFQYQIKFEEEARGKEKAEEYVNELIEYHEIPHHHRENKKEELMEKAEE